MSILIYITAALLSIAAQAGTCFDKIGQCAYYQCKEQELHCGEHGYLLNFGEKYCELYVKAEPSFTEHGQVWLDEVRSCLQMSLENPTQTYTCRNVEDYAYSTHLNCYLQAGYCALPPMDKWLVSVVGAELIINWRVDELIERLQTSCIEQKLARSR